MIYDDIDEYDGIDAHLAITHDDTYVIGDGPASIVVRTAIASFISGWRSSEVSKHHLQGITTFSASC